MSQNKINVYTCPNGHKTITKNINEGATPMFIDCRMGCNERATSCMYQCDQTLEHNHEWYKPSPDEAQSMSPGMKDHISRGGLVLRLIEPQQSIAIKCWPEQFEAIWSGKKTFEYRKNDRDYAVGKRLLLREWDNLKKDYSGRYIFCEISYMLAEGFGLAEGYCVLSLVKIENRNYTIVTIYPNNQ